MQRNSNNSDHLGDTDKTAYNAPTDEQSAQVASIIEQFKLLAPKQQQLVESTVDAMLSGIGDKAAIPCTTSVYGCNAPHDVHTYIVADAIKDEQTVYLSIRGSSDHAPLAGIDLTPEAARTLAAVLLKVAEVLP